VRYNHFLYRVFLRAQLAFHLFLVVATGEDLCAVEVQRHELAIERRQIQFFALLLIDHRFSPVGFPRFNPDSAVSPMITTRCPTYHSDFESPACRSRSSRKASTRG